MKIQFICRPEDGSTFHRILNPMQYYKLQEGEEAEMLWYDHEEAKLGCDILMYGHYMETDAKWLEYLKKDGTKFVLDLDDMPVLPGWLPGKQLFDDKRHTERVIENIRIADVVTCTNIKLQQWIRQYNKNTVVIPNAIPYGYENFVSTTRQPDPEGKMRFIYVGGSSHLDDIKSIEGKLKRIGSDGYLKQHSKFIVAGYRKGQAKRYFTHHDMEQQNENFAWVPISGVWDKITSIVGNTGTCEVLPSLNPLDYITHYDHGDVSIVPLLDREWNQYKSTLKFAEAATRNLPVMCSKVLPYSEEDAKGVIWIENNDWYNQVKYCVKNPEYVTDMGLQLAEYCKEKYDLIKWNEVRRQLFTSLINK